MTGIRRARAEDLDALIAIERSHPACPGWSREQFAEELLKGVVLVALVDGGVAAFACCREVPAAGEAQVLDVGVHPGRLRQGLGRAVVSALLEAAREDGLTKATLEVESGNAAALALYEALGFRVVGRRPNFYNEGRDALLMDLAL